MFEGRTWERKRPACSGAGNLPALPGKKSLTLNNYQPPSPALSEYLATASKRVFVFPCWLFYLITSGR